MNKQAVSLTESSDLNIQKTKWEDLTSVTYSGCILLPFVWLIMANWAGVQRTSTTLFTAITLGFFIIDSTRYHYLKVTGKSAKEYATQNKILSGMILLSGFYWGIVFAWLLHGAHLPSEKYHTFVTLTTGLALIGSATYYHFDKIGVAYPFVLLLPPITTGVVLVGESYKLFTVMAAILMVHIYITSKKSNKKYTSSLKKVEALNKHNLEIQRISRTDYLTQLGNRFHFMQEYEKAWQNSIQDKIPLSLIFTDINLLKSINHKHGYQAGDAIIKQVAEKMQSRVNAPHFLARYGGNEFAIGLLGVDANSASQMAKDIHASINEIEFAYQGTDIPFSCSVAISTIFADLTSDPAACIEKARKSLHDAQRQTQMSVSAIQNLKIFETLDNDNELQH